MIRSRISKVAVLVVLILITVACGGFGSQQSQLIQQEKSELLDQLPEFGDECPHGCWQGLDLSTTTQNEARDFFDDELGTPLDFSEGELLDQEVVMAFGGFDLTNPEPTNLFQSSMVFVFLYSDTQLLRFEMSVLKLEEEADNWPAFSPANVFEKYGTPSEILIAPITAISDGVWIVFEDSGLVVRFYYPVLTDEDFVASTQEFCLNLDSVSQVDLVIFVREPSVAANEFLDLSAPIRMTIQASSGLQIDEFVERVSQGDDCFELSLDIPRE